MRKFKFIAILVFVAALSFFTIKGLNAAAASITVAANSASGTVRIIGKNAS